MSFRRTPVAGLIVHPPMVELKAIEGDSLDTDANLGHAGPDEAVEAVLVHAQVTGSIPQSHDARCDREAPINGS